ncbi:response regulator transcription factor [Klenkia sp. PcliD-1-E]|uniref:response regulator transcription factor n=1 Tax=Klenkia sp. PcliD-1-E TaxID=2954492 RepID=UPI002096D24B|nr:response regulator transcription factor [Klenkia sp. PcliD-1-E]MCO7218386.1 response regulator transcription factor [Klenkia sp. PcliD-1-E]
MKVLLVDDEVGLTHAIARGLRAEGHAVDLAHDGISGRDAALRGGYDVVVLDIMLPGLQGYRVLEELRGGGVTTPVMMLSAKDGEYDQADAFDLGADDYLTKPFSFVLLTARLRALTRRAGATSVPVLRAGDLVLDPARHRVSRGETPIALTPREFSLLAFLMSNPDRVLNKTTILQEVWDDAFDGDVNNVEIYVGYLRRKIDVPFGRASIRTVRGAGYLLEPGGG